MTSSGSESATEVRLQVLDRLIATLGERVPEPDALPGEMLDTLVDALGGLSGAACALACSNGERVVAQRGARGAVLADLVLQELATADGARFAVYGPGESPAPGLGALAVVPLGGPAAIEGALALAWDGESSPAVYNAQFWSSVGRLMTGFCERARMAEELSARVRRSEALYRVSRTLSSTLDLDRLLSLIVSLAVDTIDKASNGVLHLLDEETGELHPRALSFEPGTLPDSRGRGAMHLGVGVAGHALAEGVLVNIPDVAHDPRFVPGEESRSYAAMMVAPLLLGERRVGTLSVVAVEPYAFGPDDEQLLLTLATLAAAAIDNARLISDLQESLNRLKMTQQQLVQSAKLSAMGQLISGLAHELNNPLTAITGYVQLLSMSPELPAEARQDLAKVDEQARRAASIVQNLLTFARQRKQEAELVDANEVLRRTLELRAYALRRADVRVALRLAPGPLGVLVAPDQLQQVFLQLISNAQDAMQDSSSPRILTITSERTADVVRIRVADNGPGLSPQAREHLFEPFFSTKEVGEGSGLGLSISFGIVSQFGGRICAEEDPPEGGAAFCIEFPIVREPIVGDAPGVKPATGRSPDGKHHVLVVDDEPEVASLLEAILAEDGHCVETCPDAGQALAQIAQAAANGTPYDLLLSDIHLPGMRGPDLYERLTEMRNPLSQHLIFITGDALDAETLEFCQAHGVTCVEKPFSLDDLLAAVDQVGAEPMSPAEPGSSQWYTR